MTDLSAVRTPRDLIAEHGRRLFEERGFAGTSVRQIAAAAGVDPSLVIRHYSSKELLFLTVIGLEGYASPPVDGPIDSLGLRLAAFVLAPENLDFRVRMAALVRASDREAVREGLRVTLRAMFIDRLVEVMSGDDREVRAQLISALLGGVVQASTDIDATGDPAVAELVGRSIQALVDPS